MVISTCGPPTSSIMPPSTEHDGSFHGAAAYAAIRLDLAEVASVFKGDPRLSDPATWCEKGHYRTDSPIGLAATLRLPLIVTRLAQLQETLSDNATAFWRRSIIDAVTGPIIHSLAPDTRGSFPSAMQLVRNAEAYLEAAGPQPVHISEICAELNVSRRTLHRAFFDFLGQGPVTFLRHKRLCAIHSILRDSNPETVTVAEVAMQQGFVELGRFSHYYHSLFGEYPSETLGSRRVDPRLAQHADHKAELTGPIRDVEAQLRQAAFARELTGQHA